MVNTEIQLDIKGVRGWLVLPAIGTGIAPFVSGYNLFDTISLLNGLPHRLIGMAAFEVLSEFALCVGWAWALFLLLSEKRIYPMMFCGLLMAAILLQIIEIVWLSSFGGGVGMVAGTFVRSIIAAAIWIPYMLVSKRVKATFVH